MTIETYVNAMKERFVIDPMITSFHVIRERSTWVDGHLRARLELADGSQLEFSEYMQRSPTGEIVVITSAITGPMPTIIWSGVGIIRRMFLISLDSPTTYMTGQRVR